MLLINNYWKQQTENNKTQIMFSYWLKTVTSSSRFWINQPIWTNLRPRQLWCQTYFFGEGFSLVHILITTIITSSLCIHREQKTYLWLCQYHFSLYADFTGFPNVGQTWNMIKQTKIMIKPGTVVPATKDRPSAITGWSFVEVLSDIGMQNVQKNTNWLDKGGLLHKTSWSHIRGLLSQRPLYWTKG